MGEEVKQVNLNEVSARFRRHLFRFSPVLCSGPKKRGNSYKKIFMEVIEHGTCV